jgi:hypothetical protein
MKRVILLSLGLLLAKLSFAGTYVIPVVSGTAIADLQATIGTTIGSDVNADVTLQFADGQSFFGGTDALTVPTGVTKLTFTATAGSNTTVNIKSATLQSILTTLSFENLKLVTTSSSTNLVGQSATFYPKSLVVKNCSLTGYRGIFAAAAGEKISVLFDHCSFKTIGSYGLVNGGSMLKDVTFSYCTFVNLGTIFNNSSWTIDASNPFTLQNCTFYNSSTQITNGFIRLASNPSAGTTVDKNIVASTVANANSLTYSSTGYNGLSFATSFQSNTYTASKLYNIQTYAGTATDIFNDPENGDLSFKSTVTGDILKCGANAVSTPMAVKSIHESTIKTIPGSVSVEGQNVNIKIYTIAGQLVIDSNANQLSTSELSNGIYIVKVTADGQTTTQKLRIG